MADYNKETDPLAIFGILSDYIKTIIKVAEAIIWEECTKGLEEDERNRFTTCFIGGSGTGKSTALNLFAALFSDDYWDEGAKQSLPSTFESSK